MREINIRKNLKDFKIKHLTMKTKVEINAKFKMDGSDEKR